MKLKYTFDMMTLDNETVAVPIGDSANKMHGIIKLNDTGARIIELLMNQKSVTEIVNALIAEYDISEINAKKCVSDFLEKLENEGLME